MKEAHHVDGLFSVFVNTARFCLKSFVFKIKTIKNGWNPRISINSALLPHNTLHILHKKHFQFIQFFRGYVIVQSRKETSKGRTNPFNLAF